RALEREAESLAARADALEADRARCEERFARRREELIKSEGGRRRHELDREEAELSLEADLLHRQWAEALAGLGGDCPAPEGPAPQAVAGARAAWLARLREEEAKADFARRWADCLVEAAEALPARLADATNVVAATA